LEDIERLRSDAGLKLLLGEMPSAEAVRFHLIGVAGEVVSHARMTFLKITEGLIGYREARSEWVEFSSA
jgi:hypothetical protein